MVTVHIHRPNVPRTYQLLGLQGRTTLSFIYPNKATMHSFQKALTGGPFTPFLKGIHIGATRRTERIINHHAVSHTLILHRGYSKRGDQDPAHDCVQR